MPLRKAFIKKKLILGCSIEDEIRIIDKCKLDSVVHYSSFAGVPQKSFLEIEDLIEYSRRIKNFKCITDSFKLRCIDTNLMKVNEIFSFLKNDSSTQICHIERDINMAISDVFVLYYQINGTSKNMYLSYLRTQKEPTNQYWFLNCDITYYYNCPFFISLMQEYNIN